MTTGWRYRVVSVLGTAVLTAAAVTVANLPVVQETFSLVPYFGRPAPVVLTNGEMAIALSTALVVLLGSMWSLFKPRPRRVLDTIMLTQKRVLLAMVGLAALGYFNYSYRLPRSTLMLTTAVLLVILPVFAVLIRRRPTGSSRAIIVGDDPEAMADILKTTDLPVLGYVSPPTSYATGDTIGVEAPSVTDGGIVETTKPALDDLACLGGLSRLDEALVEYDVDTALLAFVETDRAEFFGALDTCYDHGVSAMVHRDHADDVLTRGVAGGDLVEIDLEPWDWQDYVTKRLFDVSFAAVGLLVTAPVAALVAVAIKLDSPGPIFYSQERTAEFGQTFTVYKFRTMTVGDERSTPNDDADNTRITRVGRFLRRTHIDEVPQLLAILTGKMSVVGPRAAWIDEEAHLERTAQEWRKRWFVKPGLTGLAQINGVTSTDPQQKLRYDVEYIRKQSFWFDLKIVVRQVWQVLSDVAHTVSDDE